MKAAIAYARAIELRKTNRYKLTAPVRFAWASLDGLPQCSEGSTRDINVSGVYVLSDALPPVGALVQLDILLPNLKGTALGMRLYGEGRVFRCERGPANKTGATESGFAASVQFYPTPSELKLSRFENSGQVIETVVHEHARTVKNISFDAPALIRKKKSLRSLATRFSLIADLVLASTACL
jgi:hypothetical protein